MVDENLKPIKKALPVTICNEPAINCIRRVSLYGQGKHVFTTDNVNLKNYVKKLTLDQGWAKTCLAAESGYSPDEPPFSSVISGMPIV